MKKPNGLYEVKAENSNGDSPVRGHLWVIGHSLSDAENKTVLWLRQQGYKGFKLVKIESHGTIDVF